VQISSQSGALAQSIATALSAAQEYLDEDGSLKSVESKPLADRHAVLQVLLSLGTCCKCSGSARWRDIHAHCFASTLLCERLLEASTML
jgi:hypothetical protein